MAGFPLGAATPAFPLGEDDKRMALIQGLLAAGGGLMAAGGPSTSPVSAGQAIGAGVGQGMNAFMGAQRQAQQQKQAQLQAQYLQAQTNALTAAAAERERQAAARAKLRPPPMPLGPTAASGDPAATQGPQMPLGGGGQGFPLSETDLDMADAYPELMPEIYKQRTRAGRTVDLTPEEVAQRGLPPGTVAQRDADGNIKVVSSPDKPQRPGTVTTDAGVFIQNPDGTLGTRLGGASFAPREPGERGPDGPFGGKAADVQFTNMLLTGDPQSPAYAAAYNHLAQPRAVYDPTTGKVVLVDPDMSAYRKPGGGASVSRTAQAPAAPGTTVPPNLAENSNIRIRQVGEPATPFNEGQGKAAGFADRMTKDEADIRKYTDAGTSWGQRIRSAAPFVSNELVSKEFQGYDQARRSFVNAVLRRESGAVISPEEFDNANKQYFPQPGDDEKTIKQKAESRRIAIESMRRDAGPNYNKGSGDKPNRFSGLSDQQILDRLRDEGVLQ